MGFWFFPYCSSHWFTKVRRNAQNFTLKQFFSSSVSSIHTDTSLYQKAPASEQYFHYHNTLLYMAGPSWVGKKCAWNIYCKLAWVLLAGTFKGDKIWWREHNCVALFIYGDGNFGNESLSVTNLKKNLKKKLDIVA